MTTPMLAEFALRLAGGMAGGLLLTSSRIVPPAFFRTHCQLILALLVLAALDLGYASPYPVGLALTISSAILAYITSIAWGLGLPRLAIPMTSTLLAAVGAALIGGSHNHAWPLSALNASSRLASAALLGSTLTAMLMGHYYLTAPALTIDPLRRLVRATAWSLGIRIALGALGFWFWMSGRVPSSSGVAVSSLFLATRWLVGLAGPAVATCLIWKTVQIRSTQSATGILYIMMTLVLFGELTALIISRPAGVTF